MGQFSRKDIALTLGLVSTTVRLTAATPTKKRESLKMLCVGTDEAPHGPTPVRQQWHCDSCGGEVDRDNLKRGQAQGDAWLVVDQSEVAEARAVTADYKKKIVLVPHPIAEVLANTRSGDKVYYLQPQGDGSVYALIREAIETHPELAFTALYTPTSRASMFQLTVRGHVIMLEERVADADAYLPLPEFEARADPAFSELLDQAVNSMVAPFDPATYEDAYEHAIEALLASKQPATSGETVATPVKTPAAGNEALLAALKKMAA